jgi:hypothetical protein
MKRFGRILLNAATLLWVLLFLATLALWVFSYFAYDAVGFWASPAERRVYGLISKEGTVCFVRLAEVSGGSRWKWRHDPDKRSGPSFGGTAGFVFQHARERFVVGMPYWAVCLLLVSLPALRWARAHRRPAPGHCPACGYDLRATPERCPECGATDS